MLGKYKPITTSALVVAVLSTLLLIAARPALAQTENVLYTFCSQPNCTDGFGPDSNVVLDAQGNLYGETAAGGAHYYGTLFEVTPSGTEIVLQSFSFYGADPGGSLIRDAKGNLYGTTLGSRHSHYAGTVFERKKRSVKYLYRFSKEDRANGEWPSGLIMDAKGNLFGTAYGGGDSGCYANFDCGVVFEVTAPGVETVLYSFAGGADGSNPEGGVIFDGEGNLYGTTSYGGVGCYGFGCGTVFKLTPEGTKTVLYTFTGGTDGEEPDAGLVMDSQGNLYGTTFWGGGLSGCLTFGQEGCGTVFKVTPDGKETVLYSFGDGANGATPGRLVLDGQGNLYGTAGWGGGVGCYPYGCGTVFELTPAGEMTILYRFTGMPDGAGPNGVVLDGQGNLYGTTAYGGDRSCNNGYGCGTVFKLTP